MALHRAGQTDAERLRRELQRPDARRAPQREPVPRPRSQPSAHRRLGRRLQHGKAALRAWLPNTGGLGDAMMFPLRIASISEAEMILFAPPGHPTAVAALIQLRVVARRPAAGRSGAGPGQWLPSRSVAGMTHAPR